MYRHKYRLLFALLCITLLFSAVQANTLQVTVQDSFDNSTIPHASLFLNGINYALTDNNGQALITDNGLNSLDIRVSMAGYNTWETMVDPNTTSLIVSLTRQGLTLKVDLIDSDTLAPVYGANITVSGTNLTQTEQTDVSGSASFGVTAETLYSIGITAANYQPRSITLAMGTDDQEVQYYLLSSNRFSFVVTDKDTGLPVAGADVTLNSVPVGMTNAKGTLITQVTRGKSYVIGISAPEYQTFSETRTITDTDALDSVELSKIPVGAFIYAVDESQAPVAGANVYVNGTLSGTTNQYGRVSLPDLVSGSYLIEIGKPGYVTVSQPISVSNQSEDYPFTLQHENAALTVLVQDKDQQIVPNATIAIDGSIVGTTDVHGQYATQVEFNTSYNITASKDGYQPSSVQELISPVNSSASVTLTLEKSPDFGLITMIVVGVICILVLFAAIRMFGHRKRRHVVRRNEI
jgi:hypothetical protein